MVPPPGFEPGTSGWLRGPASSLDLGGPVPRMSPALYQLSYGGSSQSTIVKIGFISGFYALLF